MAAGRPQTSSTEDPTGDDGPGCLRSGPAEGAALFALHLSHSPDGRALEVLRGEQPGRHCGRVTRAERGGAEVLTADGPWRVIADRPVCTGDWVVVQAADRHGGEAEVAAGLPRRTALVRQGADGVSAQVLAANLDEIWLVIGIDRPISAGRLERTAVLAWESGATPVVVATKADRADDTTILEAHDAIAAAVPGAAVVAVSARTGDGLAELGERLVAGATVALIGASGTGKSTLLNAVVGRDVGVVGEVRDRDGKGRHTTSWRHLELTPSGAAVIDTPGLRAVGLWVDSGGVDAAFSDVIDVAAGCRFADCSHRSEPGCAVRQALAEGRLDPGRLERWGRLRAEAVETERRSTERTKATETRRVGKKRAAQRDR